MMGNKKRGIVVSKARRLGGRTVYPEVKFSSESTNGLTLEECYQRSGYAGKSIIDILTKDNFIMKNVFDFSGFGSKLEEAISQEVIADKTLRVGIDEQLQNLKACPRSRERSLAITKLQEAIMWLGMDLKRLNEPNPYPNSYKPENTTIEPTADGLKL